MKTEPTGTQTNITVLLFLFPRGWGKLFSAQKNSIHLFVIFADEKQILDFGLTIKGWRRWLRFTSCCYLELARNAPGVRFLKVPKAFRAWRLLPAYSVKLVFSYVVKGIKIKITAKSRALRSLRFEDRKRTMLPEMHPKSFGTFEKRAPGACFSKVPRTFQARKASCQTRICLVWKADLLTWF